MCGHLSGTTMFGAVVCCYADDVGAYSDALRDHMVVGCDVVHDYNIYSS